MIELKQKVFCFKIEKAEAIISFRPNASRINLIKYVSTQTENLSFLQSIGRQRALVQLFLIN